MFWVWFQNLMLLLAILQNIINCCTKWRWFVARQKDYTKSAKLLRSFSRCWSIIKWYEIAWCSPLVAGTTLYLSHNSGIRTCMLNYVIFVIWHKCSLVPIKVAPALLHGGNIITSFGKSLHCISSRFCAKRQCPAQQNSTFFKMYYDFYHGGEIL